MKVSIEAVNALFMQPAFQKSTKRITGEKVFRIQIGGLRHYRRGASGKIYKSLTTFLGQLQTKSEGQFIENWRAEMAVELGSLGAADEYVESTANYGTALHICTADYCRNNGVNWAEFERWAIDYLIAANFKNGTLNSAFNELTKDFAALLQFFHDYNVTVIAVELPAFLREGVATLLDLVVEMDAKQYTDKTPMEKRQRIKSIINIKSGKKGFFKEHLLQLEGERRMFNQTFGKLVGYEIEHVFNLAPNNWLTVPTYTLTNQTKTIESRKISGLFTLKLKQAQHDGMLTVPNRMFPIFTGRTEYGEAPTNAMQIVNYNDLAKIKIKEHKNDEL